MPIPSSFASTADIILHSAVPVDASTLEVIQEEAFLLIESIDRSAESQTFREVNSAGQCFMRVDYDFTVKWEVTAAALGLYGLADYSPGRVLVTDGTLATLTALEFASDIPDSRPFGFTNAGRLVYSRPRQTLRPGELPAINFEVTLEFGSFPTTVSTSPAIPAPGDVLYGGWTGADLPAPDYAGMAIVYWHSSSTSQPAGYTVRVTTLDEWDETDIVAAASGNLTALSYTGNPPTPSIINDGATLEPQTTATAAGNVVIDGVYDLVTAAWVYGSESAVAAHQTMPAYPPLGDGSDLWICEFDGYQKCAVAGDISTLPDLETKVRGATLSPTENAWKVQPKPEIGSSISGVLSVIEF